MNISISFLSNTNIFIAMYENIPQCHKSVTKYYCYFAGGVPGEVSAVTSDLYNSGLDGCVLLLQLTMMEDMWRDINLRQMAVDGRAITPCEV